MSNRGQPNGKFPYNSRSQLTASHLYHSLRRNPGLVRHSVAIPPILGSVFHLFLQTLIAATYPIGDLRSGLRIHTALMLMLMG